MFSPGHFLLQCKYLSLPPLIISHTQLSNYQKQSRFWPRFFARQSWCLFCISKDDALRPEISRWFSGSFKRKQHINFKHTERKYSQISISTNATFLFFADYCYCYVVVVSCLSEFQPGVTRRLFDNFILEAVRRVGLAKKRTWLKRDSNLRSFLSGNMFTVGLGKGKGRVLECFKLYICVVPVFRIRSLQCLLIKPVVCYIGGKSTLVCCKRRVSYKTHSSSKFHFQNYLPVFYALYCIGVQKKNTKTKTAIINSSLFTRMRNSGGLLADGINNASFKSFSKYVT